MQRSQRSAKVHPADPFPVALAVWLTTVPLAGLAAPACRTACTYDGLPPGQHRLELLLRQLDAALVSGGRVTSRSRITRVDRDSRTIFVVVVPGPLERIVVDGAASDEVAAVMPISVGDVVTVEAIEQGVQQINRLRMHDAQANLLPGDAIGAGQFSHASVLRLKSRFSPTPKPTAAMAAIFQNFARKRPAVASRPSFFAAMPPTSAARP
jgi:hypothetical protein